MSTLSPSEQLLMSLMRLRLNLDRRLLSDWFDISVAAVSNVERTWISLLHRDLFTEFFMGPLSLNRRNFPQFFPEEIKPRCFYNFVQIDVDHHFLRNCERCVSSDQMGQYSVPVNYMQIRLKAS